MTHIKKFVFNPFQVNTYVVYDQSGECVLIDPACSDVYEEKALTDFISQHRLTPVHLLITHAHIDHILGNAFASETYGIPHCAP